MMTEPLVILVDEHDQEVGQMPKMEAHEKGLLHRAVSVLLFNHKGEWMLQRRALDKYHSGGLWTNTACSHPVPNESSLAAAERRLKEEMGLNCKLSPLFTFTYKTALDHGLTEHELDHVFTAITDESPNLNEEEACDWKWMSTEEIAQDIKLSPEQYTEWFKIIFDKVQSLHLHS